MQTLFGVYEVHVHVYEFYQSVFVTSLLEKDINVEIVNLSLFMM